MRKRVNTIALPLNLNAVLVNLIAIALPLNLDAIPLTLSLLSHAYTGADDSYFIAISYRR